MKISICFLIAFCTSIVAHGQFKYTFNGDGKMLSVKPNSKTRYELQIKPEGQLLRKELAFPVTNILKLYNALADDSFVAELKKKTSIDDGEIKQLRTDCQTWLYGLPAEIKQFYEVKNVAKPETTSVPKWLPNISIGDSIFILSQNSNQGKFKYANGAFDINTSSPGDFEIRFRKPEFYYLKEWMKTFPIPADYPDKVKAFKKLISDAEAESKKLDDFNKKVETETFSGLTTGERNAAIDAFIKQYEALEASFKKLKGQSDLYEKYIRDNKKTVLAWLWYTSGAIAINPFQSINRIAKPDLEKLAYAKKKMAAITSMISQKNAISTDDVIKLSEMQAELEKTIAKLQKEVDEYNEQQASLSSLQEKDIFLYKGELPNADAIFMYHDAANKFELFTTPLKEIPESFDVSIRIENVTKEVVMEVTSTPTVESSTTADEFASINFDFAETLAKNNLESSGGNLEGRLQAARDKANLSRKNLFDALTFLLPIFTNDWSLKADLIKSDQTPAFTSNAYTITDTISAPRKVVYTLNEEGSDKKSSFSFRYNKLHWILPYAGAFYSTITTKEDDFKDGKVNEENRAGLLITAGLKIYPFRTSLRDPGFLYSNHPEYPRRNFDYTKIHLSAGVGIKEPTKDFFFGAGADLWSGISLDAGYHLMRLTQPDLENGKEIGSNDYTRGSFYIGLALDPVVFAKLYTLIFPQ